MEQFSLKEFLKSGAYMQLSPTHLLIGWGDYTANPTLISHSKTPSFYLNTFFLKKTTPWLKFEHWTIASIEELIQWVGHHSPPPISNWTIDSQKTYEKGFIQLKELFCSGRLMKGVPYIFKRSPTQMHGDRLCSIISHSLRKLKSDANYAYGYWSGSIGIVGVTPEKLFTHSKTDRQKLETMALAGTAPIEDSDSTLLENETILKEHLFVVEGIKESCSRLGEVCTSERNVVQLSTVAHLLTKITIDLKRSFDFQDAVTALHPTPALGTYPKASDQRWLEDYDQWLPRVFYGAPLGFYLPQEELSICYVAIRNVQWNDKELFIAAGGGVVKESSLKQEWEEIILKFQAIQNLLGL